MAKNKKAINKDEELNTEEFRQLIPHLELNHLFLIEIKRSGFWQSLFGTHFKKNVLEKLTCSACSEDIRLEEFETHIRLSKHTTALEKVEEFYHPIFTCEREGSAKLIENSENGEEIRTRNIEKAMEIAAKIESLKRSNSSKKNFTGNVTLSLEDLLTVEYKSANEGIWRPLVTTKGKPMAKGKYYCAVCSRYCVGIIPLNDHLRGASHRHSQWKIHAVRISKDKSITKYSVIACFEQDKCKEKKEKENTIDQKKVLKADIKAAGAKTKDSDNDSKTGLIGVEYVAQLKSDSNPESFLYVCCLCDSEIMTSAELMEKHLKSFKHRETYCELHYVDTLKNFKRLIFHCKANYWHVLPYVLEKIALGIDQYHGYGTPHLTTEANFKKSRKKVSEELHGLPHACQEFGPSFSNVVTSQEIRDFKRKAKEDDNDSENGTVRFIFPHPKKLYLNLRRHVSRPTEKRVFISEKNKQKNVKNVREQESFNKRTRSPSPENVQRKRSAHSQRKESYETADIWSLYRDQISKAAIELEKLYVTYRQQPEKHPLYEQEWNIFWRHRKDELVLEGKYYRSYNFQPEWTTYFRQRLEKMFGEDLQKSKIDVRRRLSIPIDAEEDSLLLPQYQSEFTYDHSKSKWDMSKTLDGVGEHMKSAFVSKKDDKPTVIHMLRLMTALEDHLGTLGSKILELLTEALSLEKLYPADSEVLEKKILTFHNCKYLKIAVEKLKSKLYADLIEGHKVNSFKRVIECTESILKKAEKMGWLNENEFVADTTNTQIEKLIEVLQNKKSVSPSMSKKSLSDALMDVISKKKINEIHNSYDPTIQQMEITKRTHYSNNMSANINLEMQKGSSYFPQRIQRDPINTSSTVTRGHGKSNMNSNTHYGNHFFGIPKMQISNSDSQLIYPHQNHESNSGFMYTYPF